MGKQSKKPAKPKTETPPAVRFVFQQTLDVLNGYSKSADARIAELVKRVEALEKTRTIQTEVEVIAGEMVRQVGKTLGDRLSALERFGLHTTLREEERSSTIGRLSRRVDELEKWSDKHVDECNVYATPWYTRAYRAVADWFKAVKDEPDTFNADHPMSKGWKANPSYSVTTDMAGSGVSYHAIWSGATKKPCALATNMGQPYDPDCLRCRAANGEG